MGSFFSGLGSALGITGPAGEDASNAAVDQFKGITAPQLQALKLAQLGPSAMGGVHSDAGATAAQNQAMAGLGQYTSGGVNSSDLAQMQAATNASNINNAGNQGAILQNARARGLSGSGNTLAAQMSAQQGAQNNLNQMGTNIVGGAANRAIGASSQLGALGTGVEAQRFGEGAQKAQATDYINQYNNQLGNQATIYNTTQLPQQNFSNQMGLAGAKADALNKLASTQMAQQSGIQGILGGVAQGAGKSMGASDKRLKKDIKPINMKSFMDSLSTSEYKYKAPKAFGEGKRAGPMAQDLEKTDIGKSAVVNTPVGKMVKAPEAAMLALGSVKDLHERVKKLEKVKK